MLTIMDSRVWQLVARDVGMGAFKAIMDDMGYDAVVRVCVDSSCAKSTAPRVGLGKIRHMEV
jgi:hypothetical protein